MARSLRPAFPCAPADLARYLFLFVLSSSAPVASTALADPNFGGYGSLCAQSQGLAPGCGGGGSSNGGRTQNDAYRSGSSGKTRRSIGSTMAWTR